MNRHKCLRILLAVSALMLACSAISCIKVTHENPARENTNQSISPSADETITYQNAKHGFSIDHFKHWNVKENYQGLATVFAGPAVGVWEYYTNISIEVIEIPGSITLADYVKLFEQSSAESVKNYKKTEVYDTTISGLPAKVLTITAIVSDGKGTELTVKDKVAILINNNTAYTITYDVPTEFHNKYAESFALAINSFRLHDSTTKVSFTTASLSEATITTAVDASFKPLDATDVFNTDTPEIYCSFKISNAPPDTEIKAEWIYVQGEEQDLKNYLIGDWGLSTEDTRYAYASLSRPDKGWPRGDYAVLLYINGEMELSVPFVVQ